MAELNLSPRTAAVKAVLEARPGAVGEPFAMRRSAQPLVIMFKVFGKLFAVLQIRGHENVIVKCDPHLVEVLREQYAGVGHRSHLDRRFWISIDLDSDVPADEIERLVCGSYDLVRAGLTKKQKSELEALSS